MIQRLFKNALRGIMFLAAWFLLGSAPLSVRSNFTIVGYHPYWMKDHWRQYDLKNFDRMVFFALYVEEDGNFRSLNGWPMNWGEMVLSMRAKGLKVMPSVTMLDSQKMDRLFSNPQAVAKLRKNVMDAAYIADADGLHLDFEMFDPISTGARAAYGRLVKDIKQDLTSWKYGKELYVFLLALDPSDAYDEASIARTADKVVVQGFDLHWKNGPMAGPIAPLNGWGQRNWHNILARYDMMGVSRKKILMSVPYYGYEWPTVSGQLSAETRGDGETISFGSNGTKYTSTIRFAAKDRASKFGLKRDAVSGSPYYVYQTEQGWFQGWFEDAVSLKAKYDFIKQAGLGGVAVFVPGYDNGELNATLKRAFPTN